MSKIVSVQDISCYGQCSLTVALPILSAYGFETAILPSAILSTHTGGFQNFTVHDLTDEMPAIIEHWKRENIRFDAIYTGYIGDARQFDMVKNMRTLLNPGGKLIVDPAMADHGKLYPALTPDIVEGMKTIVRAADLILPNLTEAAFLLDQDYKDFYSEQDAYQMLKDLTQMGPMGPRKAILTGVMSRSGQIGAISYDSETEEYQSYFTDKREQSYHGTGDIFSSVAIAAYMQGKDMKAVLKEACEFVCACIDETIGDETHNYGVKFEEVLSKRK